jgi:ADP-heptose:LPS heptosyltransferase
MPKKILINFPTNIGDTILGLPVLDRLKANYSDCLITAIASPHTKELLSRSSAVSEILVFEKRMSTWRKCKFSFSLRAKFDIVVDLKNSFLPIIVGGRHSPFIRKFSESTHAKDRYLGLLASLCDKETSTRGDFALSDAERLRWDALGIRVKSAIFIACASRHFSKSYPYEYLSKVVSALNNKYTLVVLGADTDRGFYGDILTQKGVIDLVGKTKLTDVFYLLKCYARLLLSVDSSILHLGSYLDTPIVALFGPTNQLHYGPWSDKFSVIKNSHMPCVPCEDPHCKFKSECMHIEPELVVEEVLRLAEA